MNTPIPLYPYNHFQRDLQQEELYFPTDMSLLLGADSVLLYSEKVAPDHPLWDEVPLHPDEGSLLPGEAGLLLSEAGLLLSEAGLLL